MSIDFADDIFQDFLIETGEILESLNEQLITLEQTPEDTDLLNAIFRGFHTIKGGAGFLNITAVVGVCHKSEDIFNLLRTGKRTVDADMMDLFLKVMDVLTEMFDDLRASREPEPADDDLLARLAVYAVDPSTQPQASAPAAAEPAPETELDVDAAFDAMLQDAQAEKSSESAEGGDDISEDEFEALLDELHGKGSAPGAKAEPATESGTDEISEDEFEALLDQLHGTGGAPGLEAGEKKAEPAPAPVAEKPKPAVASQKKPAPPPKPAPAETMVRVDTRRLDEIMNLVGELVLVRNHLSMLTANLKDDEVSRAVSNLDQVTSDLQAGVMKTRMQPVKKVFGRFPRVIRDLARSLGKEIELVMHGEETDLDKNLVEALADPLVHLVRNSADHGIEDPATREAAGKPRQGTVILSAEQEGDHILLKVEDDGKGMDPEFLRNKAVEKGLMSTEEAAQLNDTEAFNLIFAPGFSTKTEISDVSGRGVGMDVVKTKLNQLSATITIDSQLGRGSTILIKVPLTLAIMPALMVVLAGRRYALPLSAVQEIFDLEEDFVTTVDNQEVMLIRNSTVPLYYLRQWLVTGPSDPAPALQQVVTVEIEDRLVGFVVDYLIGQEEIVIKPLGPYVSGVPGFSGASVGGDGKISLILDIPSLMSAYAR